VQKFLKSLGSAVESSDIWFKDSGDAQDQHAFLVYDVYSGILAYDADGSGKKSAVQIALMGVDSHPEIQATDFVIVF